MISCDCHLAGGYFHQKKLKQLWLGVQKELPLLSAASYTLNGNATLDKCTNEGNAVQGKQNAVKVEENAAQGEE